jgi:hypothetical protein
MRVHDIQQVKEALGLMRSAPDHCTDCGHIPHVGWCEADIDQERRCLCEGIDDHFRYRTSVIRRICPECGDHFTTTRTDRHYCSDDCRNGQVKLT